ncbi:Protein of unknown function [Pyronema omphalodes CBS 100304]|uniref:Uncharacterized protein n=1 Tax=Pyronema omphalodes (strain CBS 100304) TaxID=1076935 RepID=U4LFG9_PYROM|nr:Protein of unknown function [Pyronema omphalodes CBS 100304]
MVSNLDSDPITELSLVRAVRRLAAAKTLCLAGSNVVEMETR